MRAEPRRLTLVRPAEPSERSNDGALDTELEAIEMALRAAGALAERALRGRTQPTRWYSLDLRTRLQATYIDPPAPG